METVFKISQPTVMARNFGKSEKSPLEALAASEAAPPAAGLAFNVVNTHSLFHKYPLKTAIINPGMFTRPTTIPAVMPVKLLTTLRVVKSIKVERKPAVTYFQNCSKNG